MALENTRTTSDRVLLPTTTVALSSACTQKGKGGEQAANASWRVARAWTPSPAYHGQDETLVVVGVLSDEVDSTRSRGARRRLRREHLSEQCNGSSDGGVHVASRDQRGTPSPTGQDGMRQLSRPSGLSVRAEDSDGSPVDREGWYPRAKRQVEVLLCRSASDSRPGNNTPFRRSYLLMHACVCERASVRYIRA